jgi:two-component system, NarL family, sensor histidine kinase UhpB
MISFPAPRLTKPPLLTQVLCVNAALICATVLASSLMWRLDGQGDGLEGPRSLVLMAAVLATVLVNGLVLRRRFEPLGRVIDAMEAVDFGPGSPRPSMPEPDSAEVARLHSAFTRMLRRLEAESSRTAIAVQQAQEAERARLARDLHDEANQALTGVLLRLEATMHHAPPELRAELRETQEVATQAMEELLRLARELRPAALDDLGLAAALRTKIDEFRRRCALRTDLELAPRGLDGLDPDEQLVVYRVVQEGLSNVAQHAHATAVSVRMAREGAATVVRIADDGAGFDTARPTAGLGLTGMRERAALAGGRLTIDSAPGRGTTVELRLREDAACAS